MIESHKLAAGYALEHQNASATQPTTFTSGLTHPPLSKTLCNHRRLAYDHSLIPDLLFEVGFTDFIIVAAKGRAAADNPAVIIHTEFVFHANV